MVSRWGTDSRKILYNLEMYGVPNAGQQARIAAGEYINPYWNGEMAQQPYGPSDPANYADRLAEYLPWAKRVRLPFNKNSFDDTGTFILPYNEILLSRFKDVNIEVVFPLMDGPSWTTASYGNDSSVWMEQLTTVVHPSQMLGHTRLKAWMDSHAATRPIVYAIEAINEPTFYDQASLKSNDLNTFLVAYVEHVLELWNIWKTSYPSIKFLVAGWRYSATLSVFDTFLPFYGKTAAEVIRQEIGERLIWSLHMDPPSDDPEYLRVKFGTSSGDRIIFTETNARGNHVDAAPPNLASDTEASYLFGASGDAWAKYEVGVGWWTGANYAKARLLQITGVGGPTEVKMLFFGSYSAFLHVSSYGQHPDFFTGPEFGNKNPVLKTVYEMHNPGDETPASIWPSFATCFGGRGLCVIQGLDNTQNSLHGGDGWNVLYGAPAAGNDHLYLGRGGGVIRTYQGKNRIVSSSHSPSLIYTGPGKDIVTLPYGVGSTTVIINVSATTETWIWGFNPVRGDRLSFRGAFPSAAALLAATTVVDANRYGSTGDMINVNIALPSGGLIILQGAFSYANNLSDYTKDFTDGWYQGGWTEPADYNPADLTVDPGNPIIDWYPGSENQGGATKIFSRSGQQILARKKNGSIVQIT